MIRRVTHEERIERIDRAFWMAAIIWISYHSGAKSDFGFTLIVGLVIVFVGLLVKAAYEQWLHKKKENDYGKYGNTSSN